MTHSKTTSSWAERWAAPEPAHIPTGDRPTYPSGEGRMSKCGSATLLIPPRGAAAACRRLGALS